MFSFPSFLADPVTEVLGWVWSAVGGTVVRDALVFVFNYVREFLAWLFDVEKVVDVGVYFVSKVWAFVEAQLPVSAGQALDGFVSVLHSAEVVALFRVVLWVMDQFMIGGVVVALFLTLWVIVPGCLCLRWIVYALHQAWGTGDGS